jgi:hypothetical protein
VSGSETAPALGTKVFTRAIIRDSIREQEGEDMEWARTLAYITGTADQELLLRNEYLVAENRILKAQLKERLRLSESPTNAFSKFMAAVHNLPNDVTSDDPFGPPAQLAHLDPLTVALAGKLFSSILADLAASKSADHIVSNVHTIMSLEPTGRGRIADKGCCNGQSHRLRPPGRRADDMTDPVPH